MYRKATSFIKKHIINLDSIVNKELDHISISKIGGTINVLEIGPGSKNVYDQRYLNKNVKLFFLDGAHSGLKLSDELKMDYSFHYGVAPEALVGYEKDSMDLIVCSHVIEHLSKEDGYRLIYELDRISKISIIIATPNGFSYQKPVDDFNNPDTFNMHISGWTPRELRDCLYQRIYGDRGPKIIFRRGCGNYIMKNKLQWMLMSLMMPLFQKLPSFMVTFIATKRK